MSIYFIQAGPSGPIKIGYTSVNVALRMFRMQPGNHETLRLLGWMPGEYGDEHRLLKQFASLKTRGEWHRPDVELLTFINENCDLTPVGHRRGEPKWPMSGGFHCSVCRSEYHTARTCPDRQRDGAEKVG
jgi:hypothetical protein